jgi:hypothetical protein
MLWSQDAQSELRAWAIGNGTILDVDRQSAHQARLRLLKGDPSFLGVKGKQKGGLRHSVRERLRLRF